MAVEDGGMRGVTGEQDNLFVLCKFLYGISSPRLSKKASLA